MNNRIFYTQLAILILFSISWIGVAALIPILSPYTYIGATYFLFFALFVWIAFFLGKKSLVSNNKNSFTSLVMVLIFAKLVFSLIIIVAYDKIAMPQNSYHVIHFLIFYLLYSFFEFRVLYQLSNQDGEKK